MNMYIQPKKRNVERMQERNKQFKQKFKEYMNNKRLTQYPELRESVVNNYVKYTDNKKKDSKEEIQTIL